MTRHVVAREERQARLKSLRQKLANLSEQQKQALASKGLIATVEGRVLSLHNTFMVYLQANGHIPTVVGGFHQWREAGRQVRKGEHGYTILFPAGGEKDENGNITDATRFFAGTVFDVSQTDVTTTA